MAAILTPIVDLTNINTNWDNSAFATGIFQSDEVYIDADNKVFYFKGTAGGGFENIGSGVTGQALYSFFKDRWKNDVYLPQYEFPMLSITNEQFEFINGWKIDDTTNVTHATSGGTSTTRKMIRTAGWSEVETDGTVSRRYYGFVSLGALGTTDQIYYVQDSSFEATTVNTAYTDAVNEAIQFYGNIEAAAGGDTAADDFAGTASGVSAASATTFTAATRTITFGASHGLAEGEVIRVSSSTSNNSVFIVDTVPSSTSIVVKETLVQETGATATVTGVGFDRSEYFKAFVRTRGKTYADADLVDIGVSSTTYIVYRFPITNATDLNIKSTSDTAFTGASISSITGDGTTATLTASAAHGLYVGAPITVAGGTSYNGNYTVTAISGTTNAEEVLTFASATTTSDGAGGTVKLQYVDTMDITYLPNPDSGTGDVVIKGDWTTATTFDLGDVVYDVGNSSSAANGARWYYLDATTGDSTGVDLANDTNNTWVEWTPGQRDIEEDGTFSAYTVVYDLNNGGASPGATKEIAYEYAQYQLREATDINAGANTNRKGNIADPLVFFVGSTLNTYSDTTIPSAVVLDDIADTDVNNVQYNEAVLVTGRTNRIHLAPTVVTVTVDFNPNLSGDVDSIFKAYYTTGVGAQSGSDFGSPDALVVQKVSGGVTSDVGSDVSNNIPNTGVNFGGVGNISSGSRYSFNYAFTADATNGRATGGSAAPVNITIVGLGLETGQYVITSGDITSSGGSFSLVAPLERNFIDP
jgi:hypothetical protein